MRDLPSVDFRKWQDSQEVWTIVSADYTVTKTDDYVLVDTTTAAVEVTLPPALNGRIITILRSAGANNVTITPDGSDLVNGGSSLTISSSFVPVRLKAMDNWYSV